MSSPLFLSLRSQRREGRGGETRRGQERGGERQGSRRRSRPGRGHGEGRRGPRKETVVHNTRPPGVSPQMSTTPSSVRLDGTLGALGSPSCLWAPVLEACEPPNSGISSGVYPEPLKSLSIRGVRVLFLPASRARTHRGSFPVRLSPSSCGEGRSLLDIDLLPTPVRTLVPPPSRVVPVETLRSGGQWGRVSRG